MKLIKPEQHTELLAEMVWVGTQTQYETNTLAEGLVTKEHPYIMVKLTSLDIQTSYVREDIWIRDPEGIPGRPLR